MSMGICDKVLRGITGLGVLLFLGNFYKKLIAYLLKILNLNKQTINVIICDKILNNKIIETIRLEK
jgi:hypothetical protein